MIHAMAGTGSRSQAIHAALHTGLLLPEGLILSHIRKEMSKLPPNTTVILDGYPTTAAQANSLDEKVHKHSHAHRITHTPLSQFFCPGALR